MVVESAEEEYFLLEQQLRNVLLQKEALKLQISEIEAALNELSQYKEENTYKVVGNVMVKKRKEEVEKELKEMKEDMQIKIVSLENIEKDLVEKIRKIEERLKERGG
ncbi:MAG: prefoldin subunit [Candidatus Aenigmarchaeota archaeon]|jgi:prefoldin beta subunit|nr:prefoldin subunit [Candidatus Aenigmarchaeota archaeon]